MDPAKPPKPILRKTAQAAGRFPFEREPRNTRACWTPYSPHKAAMNPEYCAIHPKAYELGTERRLDGRRIVVRRWREPGGALRDERQRLGENADFVDVFGGS